MVTHPSILLIEDSPDECELFRLALTQTGFDVTLYSDGFLVCLVDLVEPEKPDEPDTPDQSGFPSLI